MSEPVWIDEALVLRFHAEQLAEFGGMSGVRDKGLLTSALHRPKDVWAYASPKPDVPRLAAAYAFGIARNHPFFDGNKRSALIACLTFLQLNGLRLTCDQQEQANVILSLAAGELDEDALSDWIRQRMSPLAL